MADLIVLGVLVGVLAFIVRGMMHGSVRACEGDCGGCGHACASPRLKLTAEQEARLAELDKQSGVRP